MKKRLAEWFREALRFSVFIMTGRVQISGIAIRGKLLSAIGFALFLILELVGWALPNRSAFWMEGCFSKISRFRSSWLAERVDARGPRPARQGECSMRNLRLPRTNPEERAKHYDNR